MKKFVKGSLITAGILAAAGIVFCLISAIFGGRNLVYFIRNDAYMEEKIEAAGRKLDAFFDRIGHGRLQIVIPYEYSDELIVNDHVVDVTGMEAQKPMDEIRNLSLTLGAGSLVVREKNTNDGMVDIYIQGQGGCDYLVKNGTLYVEGFKGIKTIGTDLVENVITLVFPAGTSFDEVDIEVGAGRMEIVSLSAREIDAAVGAGELIIDSTDAGDLSIEIGAGRLEAYGISAKDASLTVSMGECIYEGIVSGDLDAECDMGNMEFRLEGDEKDFNYEIECAAGNIKIGEASYTALASERKINNGCHRNIEIECSMGNVEIEFTK